MHKLLEKLCERQDLSAVEAEQLFGQIIRGEADANLIAAVLIALRCKGETAVEMAGAAQALLAASESFPRPDYDTMDCCGTGGDGHGSLNVSTAVAFVLAAAGVPIAKHGNRSVSSRSGSSDVLGVLGIPVDLSAEESRTLLDRHKLCFLHAPHYHPGVRHAMPIRQSLKIRTVFNLLGPMINPARPALRLMGVYRADLLDKCAHTLKNLGVKRAWVVNGDIDELALHGPTTVAELKQDEVRLLTLSPEQVGLPLTPLSELTGADPVYNAEALSLALQGQGREAYRNAIALNAGAGLLLAKKVKSLSLGVEEAHAILRDGAAYGVLNALRGGAQHV